MELKNPPAIDIPEGLVDAIRSFPAEREIEHCGRRITFSPFDVYARCPQCGTRIKVRSFSATTEIEDVFDAFFEWLNRPGAREVANRRQQALQNDRDE